MSAFSNTLLADQYLEPLRENKMVPSHCFDPKISDFNNQFEIMTYSIESAIQSGFTHEFPIERKEANILWRYFKNQKYGQQEEVKDIEKRIDGDPYLKHLKEVLLKKYKLMGFDFGSEGDILEILSLISLEKDYPEENYFLTSGYMYHKANEHRAIGELDIVIGRRDDCKVVAIGEAKLGVHMLSKAKKQLNRFLGFLRSHIVSQRKQEHYKSHRMLFQFESLSYFHTKN